MQFTTVRSKEKDYDIYLKSEKLVHSQQEHEKNVSQFGSGKNFRSYFETNTVAAIWREKNVSLLFGDQKMQFTTVRSKEKDYYIYLKSEKLVHSMSRSTKKTCLFGVRKMQIPTIWKWKKLVHSSYLEVEKTGSYISSLTNSVAAIWREKKVDPCYLETKKCSSQLLGARKKIMTSI